MSPPASLAIALAFRFPRVSGDEPLEKLVGKADLPFSPRERG